jgi:hypothetical protein
MTTQQARGSAKLWSRMFDKDAPAHEELAKAITGSREGYKVLRWWKYGQPAIDLIKGTIEVAPENAGAVIQNFIGHHGKEVQVTLEVFPYGIPFPDIVRLDVVLERQAGQ